MRTLVLSVTLALGACASASPPALVTPRVACPAVLTAAAPEEPVRPALTVEQRLALDVATIRAVGAPLAAAMGLADVMRDAWARDGWSRVSAGRAWCETLDTGSVTVADSPG